MIETSAAFAQAIGGTSRRFRARLRLDGGEVAGELRRMTVHLGSCAASAFAPGTVFSSYAELTLAGAGRTFEGRELSVELGVQLADGSWEYAPLGLFTAERPAASVYETTFFARGRIAARFAGAFTPPEEPTLAAVLAALAEQTGVPIVLRGVAAAGRFGRDLSGLTCRQVLAAVAGVLGGYATERSDGAVVLARYTATPTLAVGGDRMTALPTFADGDTTVTGVRVTVPATAVSDRAVYETGEPNLERTDEYMTRELFAACGGNLRGLTWRAGTARLALGDPRLEPWDTLAVTDTAGRTFYLPCMSVVHSYDGGLATTVTAPGLPAEGASAGGLGQALNSLRDAAVSAEQGARRAWTAASGKNTVYYGPTAPAGGTYAENDVWFDTDDGGRMYRWDGTAWAAQSFGSGALAAGAVTAEKLAAGAVTADKIAADVLTSRNIDLYGRMTVYTDEGLGLAGGALGYMAGLERFADGTEQETDGMAMSSPGGENYLIVTGPDALSGTNGGVRLTSYSRADQTSYSAYLSGNSFRTTARQTHVNDLFIHGRTSGGMTLLWENPAPAAAFPADRTVPIEGLADYDLFLVQYRYSTEADEKWSGIFYAEPLTSTRCYVNAFYRDSEHAYRGIALFYGEEEAVHFGYANHNGAGDTASMIPQRIYGTKI